MITLLLILFLFTKHFIIDFLLQGQYQWKNKGTYGHPGGLLHSALHGNKSGMEKYRCRDMGMDATGAIAITMEDAIASAMKGEIKGHH